MIIHHGHTIDKVGDVWMVDGNWSFPSCDEALAYVARLTGVRIGYSK